ncbi:MAG: hypothetical protein ACI8S6_000479 [Myxococcota bacterium]|jgi:hypothetical protein
MLLDRNILVWVVVDTWRLAQEMPEGLALATAGMSGGAFLMSKARRQANSVAAPGTLKDG